MYLVRSVKKTEGIGCIYTNYKDLNVTIMDTEGFGDGVPFFKTFAELCW